MRPITQDQLAILTLISGRGRTGFSDLASCFADRPWSTLLGDVAFLRGGGYLVEINDELYMAALGKKAVAAELRKAKRRSKAVKEDTRVP